MAGEIKIIAGSFHKARVERMCKVARETADSCGFTVTDELWVPGTFEVPLALQRVLERGGIDGAVLLGIVERGETKHGMVMAQAVFPAIIQLQLKYDLPIGLGIIGPEVTDEQIEPRIEPHARAAVRAVVEMGKFLV